MKHVLFPLALWTFIPYLNSPNGAAGSVPLQSQNSLVAQKDGPNLLRLAPDVTMLDLDDCFRHGGTVGAGISWNIATCKSHCTRGLGFRCGTETYLKCGDGTIVITGWRDDNCPADKSRQISADMNFYDNNTLSLKFFSALPEEEKDNDEFEVEEDLVFNTPAYLLIGDRHYASYTVKKGTYKVDRSVGEFGQVLVDFEFNQ
jgi:hypothetical protein